MSRTHSAFRLSTPVQCDTHMQTQTIKGGIYFHQWKWFSLKRLAWLISGYSSTCTTLETPQEVHCETVKQMLHQWLRCVTGWLYSRTKCLFVCLFPQTVVVRFKHIWYLLEYQFTRKKKNHNSQNLKLCSRNHLVCLHFQVSSGYDATQHCREMYGIFFFHKYTYFDSVWSVFELEAARTYEEGSWGAITSQELHCLWVKPEPKTNSQHQQAW